MSHSQEVSQCHVFGSTSNLKDNMLLCYECTRFNIKITNHNKKEPNFEKVSVIFLAKNLNIWKKTLLPTVSNARVFRFVTLHFNTYLNRNY